MLRKFIGMFKRESKNIDNANKDLKDLASGKMESVNEGVIKRTVMVPKEYEIKYDMNMSLFDWTDSEEDAAESIASALGLQSGYIEYGGKSTEVKGITEKGKSIVIKQDGEFDMYGGPYDPKMGKPTVIYDGKNITKKVEAALFKEYGSPDGGFGGGKNNHDVSRVDLWSNILT